MRGQLEGVSQNVELLDFPRLPGVDSPRDLKGPGVPFFSRTGLQEVLSGCLSLQLNEELREEISGHTSTHRPAGKGSKDDRATANPGHGGPAAAKGPTPPPRPREWSSKIPLAYLKQQGALHLKR